MAINRYDVEGVLTINGFSLNRPAISCQGLSRLWVEVDKRGSNRVIPGAAGVITLPVRNTETRHNLLLLVVGSVTLAGTPATCTDDQREILLDNLDGIYSNVVNQGGDLAASITVFGQANRTADVQVLGMREQRVKLRPRFSAWLGSLEFRIPGGRFE